MKAAMFLSVALLAGCAHQPEQLVRATPSPSQWTEPASYAYVLDSTCGERPLFGRFRVEVAGHHVTRATGLDQAGRYAVAHPSHGDPVPTIGGLLAELARARQHGAHVATIDHDPTDGHPVRITIDQNANAIDDEACFSISSYEIAR
ncbi:DUF6174 domain-containing protein [Fodinicola acaciae]|uniref:DUF6174 domain-containing protein n=1 Tax=Fodinicola acaciae TaxID=2681555 RepID=UPI0013D17EE0|nr:DUF6174 domain-containing protein [Fodinicola acaciae]